MSQPKEQTGAPDAAADSENAGVDGASSGSGSGEKESSAAPKPPSHQRRVENVKRIRDGAARSHRNKKSRKVSDDSHLRELNSLVKTIKTYITF